MPSQTTKRNDKAAANMLGGVKIYGKGDTAVNAIDGINIDVHPAQFTAIMGPSGSGKSTLLQCLAGLDTLTAGSVHIAGKDLSSIKDRRLTILRRQNVGFIFQAFNLIPTLTAKENILLPLTIARQKVDHAWFEKVIGKLKIADRLNHIPSELSGGQQQRVAAARALIAKPEIIFADEPSGNLDSKSGHELLEFMRAAVDDLGQSIVMVTHDPNAASFADRVIFLDDGRIVDEMQKPTAVKIFDRLKKFGD